MARDVSEGGVFVQYRDDRIRPGSKIKLTVLNPNSVDAHATPTVELTVRRVDEQGMGLEFLNRTGRHLWQSVDRLRSELAVGRDYFQLHVSALAMNDRGDLLLVQNNGKWQFPGFYLTDSGYTVDWSAQTAEDVAGVMKARDGLRVPSALVVANPLPVDQQLDPDLHDRVLDEGLRLASARNITGKDVTPFLLDHFHRATHGASLIVNEQIIVRNAELAARIAVADASATE